MTITVILYNHLPLLVKCKIIDECETDYDPLILITLFEKLISWFLQIFADLLESESLKLKYEKLQSHS